MNDLRTKVNNSILSAKQEQAEFFANMQDSYKAQNLIKADDLLKELSATLKPIELYDFLQTYIMESGYDVSMQSDTSRDMLNHYEWTEKGEKRKVDKLGVGKKQAYTVSFLDLVSMYTQVQFYKAHNFATEIQCANNTEVTTSIVISLQK